MDTSHILKPTATVSNSLFSKIKRFLAAALLADFVLGNAINVFIENLNKKGLLGLGSDFQAYQMIWGESIWLNILHLIILGLTAGIFGFTFGYLSRRVSLSEKIIFTFFYVFIRLIFLALFSVIIDFFIPSAATTWNEVIGLTIYVITSSAFNATFVILGYIVMFASAFYFIDKGSKVINDPYYTTKPPIAEQKEIAKIFLSFNEKLSFLQKKKQTLTDLFKTLLHELMTGQRRVHEIEFETLTKAYKIKEQPLSMAAEK